MILNHRHIQELEKAMVQIGYDLGIFTLLADAKDPMSEDEIASATGADAALMSNFPLISQALLIVPRRTERFG